MFTGIIQELGTVARIERQRGLTRLSLDAPKTAARVQPLESVAVNGVCLTVVGNQRGLLMFEVIPHTQQLTSLSMLRAGDRVNLEPSLSLTDRLGGHVLFGHVDGLGKILKCSAGQGERSLDIGLPAEVGKWIIPQGPVAVDGVSLTVGSAPSASRMRVHLIPETLRQTTLASRAVGDRVNIEIDYFAKLTWQFLRHRPTATRVN
jgi:riboflavin synthase